MMCDIITTGLIINNNINITSIPCSYLARIEKQELQSLDKLNNLIIEITDNNVIPYKEENIETTMQYKYQPLCNTHIKTILTTNEKIGNYIYVSMDHFKDDIKMDYKEFYYTDSHLHLHFVLQFCGWDNDFIKVKQVLINNKEEYLLHQDMARKKEQRYNLKYNLKEYLKCPCCLPTICGVGLFYKDTKGNYPMKLYDIHDDFKKALTLFKNDRINMSTLCNLAEKKWKCDTYEKYHKKIYFICEKHNWNFNTIISFIHNTHYNLLKDCERIKEKSCNNNTWIGPKKYTYHSNSNRNLNSPSWRSCKILV